MMSESKIFKVQLVTSFILVLLLSVIAVCAVVFQYNSSIRITVSRRSLDNPESRIDSMHRMVAIISRTFCFRIKPDEPKSDDCFCMSYNDREGELSNGTPWACSKIPKQWKTHGLVY